jgi:hypothetical protein
MSSADEVLELVRADLAQTLEPRDLRGLAQLDDGPLPFLIAVTVDGLLLVPHPEERCLQDVEVVVLHQVREELEEEGHQQQPDVHTVHIRIGGDDDLVVAQAIHAVLDVERGLDQVELLVLVHHFLR